MYYFVIFGVFSLSEMKLKGALENPAGGKIQFLMK